MARFILAQLVLHVLKKDRWMRDWYRRGAVRGGTLFGSLRRCHDAAAITERQPDEIAPLSARES